MRSNREGRADVWAESRRPMARPLGEPGWERGRDAGRSGRGRSEPQWGSRRPPRDLRRWIGPLVLLVIAGSAVGLLLNGLPRAAQPPSESTPGVTMAAGLPSPSADANTAPGGSLAPSPAQLPTASPNSQPTVPATPRATSSPSPTAEPSPSRPPGAAPASAEEFDADRGVVIDMAFPIKPGASYRYRDNWLNRRPGPPEHYNHVRGRRGTLVRAHDGTDIYARTGTPVVAPFSGQVIEPAERWQPWHPERYGETVVIISDEPLSEGYAALLSHLGVTFVEPGDVVRRGEVVGLAGNSGNAEGGPAHVHFELRAPFVLEWLELGEIRLIDAFNPYPSLRAADPEAAD